jgi:hypothetical protein
MIEEKKQHHGFAGISTIKSGSHGKRGAAIATGAKAKHVNKAATAVRCRNHPAAGITAAGHLPQQSNAVGKQFNWVREP